MQYTGHPVMVVVVVIIASADTVQAPSAEAVKQMSID